MKFIPLMRNCTFEKPHPCTVHLTSWMQFPSLEISSIYNISSGKTILQARLVSKLPPSFPDYTDIQVQIQKMPRYYMQYRIWSIFHSLWLVNQTLPYSMRTNNIIIPTLYYLFLLVTCQLAQLALLIKRLDLRRTLDFRLGCTCSQISSDQQVSFIISISSGFIMAFPHKRWVHFGNECCQHYNKCIDATWATEQWYIFSNEMKIWKCHMVRRQCKLFSLVRQACKMQFYKEWITQKNC